MRDVSVVKRFQKASWFILKARTCHFVWYHVLFCFLVSKSTARTRFLKSAASNLRELSNINTACASERHVASPKPQVTNESEHAYHGPLTNTQDSSILKANQSAQTGVEPKFKPAKSKRPFWCSVNHQSKKSSSILQSLAQNMKRSKRRKWMR